MTDFKDMSKECGIFDEVDHVCAPNQCRIDNGYGSYCDNCLCSSCTRSDCHKEAYDTTTIECFGCVQACKVECLDDNMDPPDGCIMDSNRNGLVKWEYP